MRAYRRIDRQSRHGRSVWIVLLALFVLWEPNVGWAQGICGRNAQIRDLILAQLSGTACGDVTDQQLAGITVLARVYRVGPQNTDKFLFFRDMEQPSRMT